MSDPNAVKRINHRRQKVRRLFSVVGYIVRRSPKVSIFFIISDKKVENRTSRTFNKKVPSSQIEKKTLIITLGSNEGIHKKRPNVIRLNVVFLRVSKTPSFLRQHLRRVKNHVVAINTSFNASANAVHCFHFAQTPCFAHLYKKSKNPLICFRKNETPEICIDGVSAYWLL